METYTYTKKLSPDVLTEAIKLRTSLRKVFTSIEYREEADGTVEDKNVSLMFNRALTSSEQDEITQVVNDMSDTYDLVVRKGLERDVMTWAETQGNMLIRQFGANNIYQQKTDEQIDALATNYKDVLSALSTGSLKSAYRQMLAMQPDSNISQAEIDEFTIRIMEVLGL